MTLLAILIASLSCSAAVVAHFRDAKINIDRLKDFPRRSGAKVAKFDFKSRKLDFRWRRSNQLTRLSYFLT